MDTSVEKAITVFMSNGNSLKFEECSDGLYYYDTSIDNSTNSTVNVYPEFNSYNLFNNSVSNNKKSYSKIEIKRAIQARKMHHQLGWPSAQQFKHYVKNNMLKNCDIDVDDINRAEKFMECLCLFFKGRW